ncbi:Subtilisin-like serine proteases-like protein [Synechococcus sp. WH 8109]|nr:Subtilisin-like serine proteases-like protein [Synechococcus sp. WH 8109]
MTDNNGQIASGTGWQSGEDLRQQGYESIFNLDLDNDGHIGEPPQDNNDDFDNTTNTSGYIEVGGTAEGTLEVSGDRDWLRINLVAGNVYSFAVEGQALDDTYLRFYDSNGNLLEENDDYNGFNSAINNYQAEVTGDYYLGVGAYADTGTGNYIVSANNNNQIEEPPQDNNDDYDNTTNTSGYIEVGGTAEGTLEVSGDRDWLRINLVAGNVYSFAVEGQALDDTYLRFYDSNGNLLEENDDYNGLNSAINNYQAEVTGDYYLGVGAYADTGIGNYIVSANNNNQIEEPPQDNNDDYDNTTNTSGYIEVGGTAEGTLEVSGDRDWLRINLVAGNVYSFAVEGQALDDTYLRFYDSTGNLLEENDDYNGLNSAINNYQAEVTGDYYLGVGAYADTGTGNYIVSANNNNQIDEPPQDNNDDYDNTTNTSGYIEVGGTAEGTLEVSGDRDWLRINLVAGNVYSFAVEGQALDDTYLRFYDSNGNLLEENDDYNGLNSAINNYQAEVTGDYYLGVGAYADTGTGNYIVSINETPLPPAGYSSSNGYGQINIQRAFEQYLNVTLAAADALGGNSWTLDNIYAPEVWRQSEGFAGATGLGAVVAVIDTGVDLDHREFTGRIVQGYDFVDNDLIADDGNGHGTHVAGTIAGAYDDFGVTGVAFDSEIMPIRVLGNDGTGYTSDIISGIRYAADNNADVINLSLGGGGYSQSMADAIEYATNRGSVVVMAAGNSGGISPEYPAAHAINNGLAVGAVDQYENLADFSNLAGSTTIDYVTAPGVDVYSSIPGDSYAFYSGTSMATPHVAGAAALLSGYDPSLSAESIADLLTGTASNTISDSSVNYLSSANLIYDEITYGNAFITAENVSSFSPEEFSGILIGRASDTCQFENFSEIDNMPILPVHQFEELTSNLYALNFDGLTDAYSYVSELLQQNYFHYFEFDQAWTVA